MTGAAVDRTAELPRIQRRVVTVLATGQVLGGIAFGATVSLGGLLARDLSGQDALSGMATAAVTLGAAICAIPLARLAARRGRRMALGLGNAFALVGIAIVLLAAAVRSFPLLLVGVLLIGAGNAGNLQSRFAATDLAAPEHRGRDLSLVVWSTTVGGVSGPLLVVPGETIGAAVGMPPLTGAYLFAVVAQTLALILYLIALRPDPLLFAREWRAGPGEGRPADTALDRPRVARYAIFAVAGSHVVMVSVMAMTPVHLSHLAVAMHGEHASATDVTALVGITIGLHVAGMYALSPVFGLLSDRWGALRVILCGQVLLVAALLAAVFWSDGEAGVIVALILLGLGWSASTVAGSALLTAASSQERRASRQGISDAMMSLCGAVGATLAGVVLSVFAYPGLAVASLAVVLAVVIGAPSARERRSP